LGVFGDGLKKKGGNWRNLFSGGWGNRGGVDAVTI